jgi:hypothetical protein
MDKKVTMSAITMIVLIALGISNQAVQSQSQLRQTQFHTTEDELSIIHERKAPIAIVGDNVYIVWPTNKTGNDEVQFRASTDGGTTFADKINLSNTTDAESQDVEIAADGDNVIITWWERNQTAEEPIAWISTDNGETFGPLLKLAMNGTIGESE